MLTCNSSLDIRLNSSLRRDPKQSKLVSESSHSEPWIYRCDSPKLMTIACLSGDIACDTIIAGSVCYYLQRSRTGFKRYVFHSSCLRPDCKMRTERIRSSTYWSHMLSEPVCSQRRHFLKALITSSYSKRRASFISCLATVSWPSCHGLCKAYPRMPVPCVPWDQDLLSVLLYWLQM